MKKSDTNNKAGSGTEISNGMKRRNFVKLLGGGIFVFFQPWDVIESL